MFLKTPIEVDGVIRVTGWFWPEKIVNIAVGVVEQPPLRVYTTIGRPRSVWPTGLNSPNGSMNESGA